MPRLTEAFFKRVFKASKEEGVPVKIDLEHKRIFVTPLKAGAADEASGSESLTPLEEWRKKKKKGRDGQS